MVAWVSRIIKNPEARTTIAAEPRAIEEARKAEQALTPEEVPKRPQVVYTIRDALQEVPEL
jgi:hypothetical protein